VSDKSIKKLGQNSVSGDYSSGARCGYVAIVGRPNVGKSTLLNHLLGRKLSITSRKPQTTRHTLLGLHTEGDAQVIFVDTPGIHVPSDRAINRYMVRTATSVLYDVDLVIMMIEGQRWTEEDDIVLQHVRNTDVDVYCVINKIDQIKDKESLLPYMQEVADKTSFKEIIPISALRDDGVAELLAMIVRTLPSGPHLFPADQLTDKSERFLIGEIVREKLMRRLGDELPHRQTVVVESFKTEPGIVHISAIIYVEREGQKAIVIGKKGALLKSVGQDARKDIERLIDQRVMLRLWVKVKSHWTNSEQTLKHLGYD